MLTLAQVAVVTGGTGIGYEVARLLAVAGSRVIILAQKIEHGMDAVARIQGVTRGAADVEWLLCDLGNLSEVKRVGDKIRNEEGRLDLVRQSLYKAVGYADR